MTEPCLKKKAGVNANQSGFGKFCHKGSIDFVTLLVYLATHIFICGGETCCLCETNKISLVLPFVSQLAYIFLKKAVESYLCTVQR